MNNALVEKTLKVIETISTMESIKPYVLVGGTALSLQLEHRLSEDLDFMRWQESPKEKMEIDISGIKKELQQRFTNVVLDILEFNHVEIFIEGGVKLSFYAPEKRKPRMHLVQYLNNIKIADIDAIAALKMETLLRRALFRDYYDLYCIFQQKNPEEIKSIMDNALKYSGHNLKSKNLIGMLINSYRFRNDSSFAQLEPKYLVSGEEIEAFMIERVKKFYL